MSEGTFHCVVCEDNHKARPGWGPGPWQDEPDALPVFRHAGLDCLVHRGGEGVWCGYVAVPPGHFMHGKWPDEAACYVSMANRLSYARGCNDIVCHKPAPGESDDVWWLGFACDHLLDVRPGKPPEEGAGRPSYSTVEFAVAETKALAEQLAGLADVRDPRRSEGCAAEVESLKGRVVALQGELHRKCEEVFQAGRRRAAALAALDDMYLAVRETVRNRMCGGKTGCSVEPLCIVQPLKGYLERCDHGGLGRIHALEAVADAAKAFCAARADSPADEQIAALADALARLGVSEPEPSVENATLRARVGELEGGSL